LLHSLDCDANSMTSHADDEINQARTKMRSAKRLLFARSSAAAGRHGCRPATEDLKLITSGLQRSDSGVFQRFDPVLVKSPRGLCIYAFTRSRESPIGNQYSVASTSANKIGAVFACHFKSSHTISERHRRNAPCQPAFFSIFFHFHFLTQKLLRLEELRRGHPTSNIRK